MDVMHSTLRDMEHFHTNLIQENDKLNKECEYSKVILYLVQENIQLRATNQTLRDTSSVQENIQLRATNQTLRDTSSVQENIQLRATNQTLRDTSSVQENIQLRATNQTLRDTSSLARGYDDNNNNNNGGGGNSASYDSGGVEGGGGGGSLSGSVAAVAAAEPSPALDKSSFYRHLQANDDGVIGVGGAIDPSSGAAGPRTSSPDNFHTFLSSMQADDESTDAPAHNNNNHNNHNNNNKNNQPRPQEEEQASGGDDDDASAAATAALRRVRQPGRLLGEIAFQLDQRILSHIFQGQTRLYGFTVHNIGRKIADVSVHPVTGRADDAFRARLERRRSELMRRLGALGYKPLLHPTFTEFVVNAYGIAEQRGGGLGHAPAATAAAAQEEGGSSQDDGGDDAHYLDDAHFLARLVASAAPAKLHRDLMVLLRCLAAMAAEDGRPLFLW